jgi:hypothetical protein
VKTRCRLAAARIKAALPGKATGKKQAATAAWIVNLKVLLRRHPVLSLKSVSLWRAAA